MSGARLSLQPTARDTRIHVCVCVCVCVEYVYRMSGITHVN